MQLRRQGLVVGVLADEADEELAGVEDGAAADVLPIDPHPMSSEGWAESESGTAGSPTGGTSSVGNSSRP